MPIQFQCSGCQQPIEVDDEHAGRSASCPYCQRVVTIPQASTLEPQQVVQARRLLEADAIVRATLDPQRELVRLKARSWGNYALISMALMLLLFAIYFIRIMSAASAAGLIRPGEPPTAEDQQRLVKAIEGDALVIGLAYGALFFALIGLLFGVASLRGSLSGNWRGILSSVACGLYLLCQCGGILMMGAALGAG